MTHRKRAIELLGRASSASPSEEITDTLAEAQVEAILALRDGIEAAALLIARSNR